MVLVYLSAPIIKKSSRKDDFCNRVVTILEDLGLTVFAPQLLGPAEPEEIYRRDVHNVRMCDFVLTEVSDPSLGVGMEIMLAIELMRPVLMFFDGEIESLSKMVRGADGKVLIEYNTLEDVEKKLRAHNLENLIVQKCPVCDAQVAEVLEEGLKCIGCGSGGHQVTV
ncbi:MAG: 2'-deoxynucleoside 5'-phosphate N-hydrolase 1 [Candidatus Thorarchaeota archaeon AB_25]|nr:MAG: 2'-deoxynucleoside 5'-phosphate N-hydrolase 1 [Candidatus Thorarchaeota archaeon AB_25]